MKKYKIIFWISTVIIFLFEGVMPALTFNTEIAREGIQYLGYPPYFSAIIVPFKIVGVLALIVPRVPARIKEWAYAGFAFNFISASASHWMVDRMEGQVFFPLVILAILIASYITYQKLNYNRISLYINQ